MKRFRRATISNGFLFRRIVIWLVQGKDRESGSTAPIANREVRSTASALCCRISIGDQNGLAQAGLAGAFPPLVIQFWKACKDGRSQSTGSRTKAAG